MIKRIIQVISILFFINRVYAQAPAIEWQNTFGGLGAQDASGMQQTSDGGYITCGSADGLGAWFVKLEANGNIIWTKSISGGNPFSIQQTSDGGYITAGSGGPGVNTDYWIARLDNNGDPVWVKLYGGSLNERAFGLQQTTDGGFIIAGEAESSDGDVTGSHGYSEAWVLKLDDLGNIVWKKSFGGSGYDGTRSIKQTPDGGYIFAGTTNSTDGDPLGTAGMNGQLWIVKLNVDGTINWQKRYGSNIGAEFATSICLTSDGGYAATALANRNGGDVTGVNGTAGDYWIVKLNANGILLWQKAVGGSDYEVPTCIIESTHGNLVVLGWGFSNNGNFTGNHGNADDWIVKLSSTGSLIWQKALGGLNGEMSYTVCQTTDKGYTIAGYSASDNTGDVGSNPTLPRSNDFWIVKLASETRYSNTDVNICSSALPYSWNGQDYDTAGVYHIILEAANGADSILSLNLSINPTPEVNLGKDTTICLGKTLMLDVTTVNASYLWQDGSINPGYNINKEGVYWVKLNINGCDKSDTIAVGFKECSCTPSIPNAFTPNGDGINDQWIFSNSCDAKINISVYNRYGSLIYYSDNYHNDWKGTYGSKSCPDGTYYYIARLAYPGREEQISKGNVTILR